MHDDDDDLFSNLDIDYLNVSAIESTNAQQNSNANVAANQSSNAQQNAVSNVNHFLDDDDDIFFEANIPDSSVVAPSTNNLNTNHNAFDDDDDFDVAEIEANIQHDIEQRRPATSNTVSSLRSTVDATPNQALFDSDFEDMFPNDSVIKNAIEPVSHNVTSRDYEHKIAGCPLVTISQLHSMDGHEKCEQSFVVKCEIAVTVGKLKIEGNRYEIVALITDSTDLQLEVSWAFMMSKKKVPAVHV